MRRISLTALATVCVLAAPATAFAEPPEGRDAAVKGAGVRVLSKSQQSLLRSGRLRVRVRYAGVGRVRVLVRVPRGRSKRPIRIAKAGLTSFRRPGVRRVSLRLFRSGRAYLRTRIRGCSTTRFIVLARARGYKRGRGRTLFSPLNKSRRSRFTKRTRRLGAGTRACARRRAPGGGQGGAGGAFGGGEDASLGLRAGAATSDITPPVGTPMFAYTARSCCFPPGQATLQIISDPDENLHAKTFAPSNGIHTRLRARAIVIEQGGKKFAMVQADLGGLPYAMTQEVQKRIEGTGIAPERLLLNATHTHSATGPIWPEDNAGYGLLGGDTYDPRIFALTAEGIAESIRSANERLQAARVGVGTAELRGASSNRNINPHMLNAEVPDTEAAARPDSIDPQVTVVRVDARDGTPLGVWSNFAVHPTSFGASNLLFSGDNPGAAERLAEEKITQEAARQGPAPPADRPLVNVWTNGNEGDISASGGSETAGSPARPLYWVPGGGFGSSHNAGRKQADGILRAWQDAGDDLSTTTRVDARRKFVDFDGTQAGDPAKPVGPLAVLGAGGITGPDGFCSPVEDAGGPGQGNKFPTIPPSPAQPTGPSLVPRVGPVEVWRVGSLGIVGLPAEVTKQQGVRIRGALTAGSGGQLSQFVLAGLSNGYLSYTSTPEEYDACHYEGSFTLFGRHQGPRYQAFALPMVTDLLGGPAAPSAPEPPQQGVDGGAPSYQVTPTAGDAVTQPGGPNFKRYDRVTFRWRGGDPAVDAPRNHTFVALQHQEGSDWRTIGTDDTFYDTTQHSNTGPALHEWLETWQLTECDPTGAYRFRVTGVADKGSGAEPYEVISDTFQVGKIAALDPSAVSVAGGTASFFAEYPDPGDGLVSLPRRVRSGFAVLTVDPPGAPPPVDVRADLDSDKLNFVAHGVPDGSAVTVKSVEDGCGNTGP